MLPVPGSSTGVGFCHTFERFVMSKSGTCDHRLDFRPFRSCWKYRCSNRHRCWRLYHPQPDHLTRSQSKQALSREILPRFEKSNSQVQNHPAYLSSFPLLVFHPARQRVHHALGVCLARQYWNPTTMQRSPWNHQDLLLGLRFGRWNWRWQCFQPQRR